MPAYLRAQIIIILTIRTQMVKFYGFQSNFLKI